jgi:uncharacterized membrane protein YeaQ/YmgE (transglycosylase-associated protein family)
MLHMIGHALFGLMVGLIARLLLPGQDPHGVIVTALIGLAGGWLGGFVGQQLGLYKQGQAAGFVMSVIGAMVLLVIARMVH